MSMKTRLYLQKAEMLLAKGMDEKALESLLTALSCLDGDVVSESQVRCFLGEYYFVYQQYAQSWQQFTWIINHAKQLKLNYDDLLNEEIQKAEILLGIMQRFGLH